MTRTLTARRRWLAAAALVGVGWLVTPHPVPVYDGIGQPDEPYRYVVAPSDGTTSAAPTEALATTPVKDGRGTNGLSVATREVGPQFSLFLPPQSMGAAQGPIEVHVVPRAPADQPDGATLDGNVYVVTLTAPGGPVTLTDKARIATVYLRATSPRQPPPVLEHREAAGEPWKALETSRGGSDFYVAAFPGPGEFAVAFPKGSSTKHGGGFPVLPAVLVGLLVVVVAVVVVVRLRAAPE